MNQALARRRFLEFIAASPLLAIPGLSRAQSYDALRAAGTVGDVITDPRQALNVFDFELAAKKALEGAPAHFGYLQTGVDDDGTVRANREAFSDYTIRVRRLIDARKVDTRVSVLGETWASPIVLAPVSSQGAFNFAERELGVARAARKRGHQMILSTVGNSTVEEVSKEHGSPVWYMLYPTDDWNVTQALVKRAEAAGAPAIVLTVDRQGGRNTETLFRARHSDTRDCTVCHKPGSFANEVVRKPMFSGLDVSRVTNLYGTGMTWDYLKRLRDTVKGKLVLKGIMAHEDARESLRYGIDALIVSNHGGRAEASGQSTLGVLPEIVQAVNRRVPVLVDGGFRRGTDVYKALALGASAVGVGRPYCWGLAAFGQPGVERVLEIMQTEFETIMRQAGTTTIASIDAKYLARAEGGSRLMLQP